jgi:hypothetical protein
MASLPLYSVAALLLLAMPGWTSSDVKQMLQEFPNQGDLRASPDMGALADRLDVLRSEPVAEVRQILPLAFSLLRSDNPIHESIGQHDADRNSHETRQRGTAGPRTFLN